MSKIKTTFNCNVCGSNYSKWQGQCNSCKSWNSISEEVVLKLNRNPWEKENVNNITSSTPQKISNIIYKEEDRLYTSDSEFNRVLGGGIIPGSLILLGGEPGIGKSTLLLQISVTLPYSTLYVSGEESQSQIKMRIVFNLLRFKTMVGFIHQDLTCVQRLLSHGGCLAALIPGAQSMMLGGFSNRL